MKALYKRKMLVALSSIALMLLSNACSDTLQAITDNQKTKPIGQPVKLEKLGTLTYAYSSVGSFDVKVLSIEDNRCPKDVVCIWQGEARVGFQIGVLKKVFQLCLGGSSDACRDAAEFTYEGRNFLIRLTDVTPYPNTTKPNESKVVVFIISEL